MSNNQKNSFTDLAKKMVSVPTAFDIDKNTYEHSQADINKQNITIIADDTSIIGDIKTKGNLDIKGELTGNVDADGIVSIKGKVQGDIRANAVTFSNADHKGNMNILSQVVIDKASQIIGNVTAGDIVIDGTLTGDIEVKGNIRIDSNAVIHGNITASGISVGQGAVINGIIETKALTADKNDISKQETTSSILKKMDLDKQ